MLSVKFHSDPHGHHALIRKLFTGAYHPEVEQVSAPRVLLSLAQTLLS